MEVFYGKYVVYSHNDRNGKSFYVGCGRVMSAFIEDKRPAAWLEAVKENGGRFEVVILETCDTREAAAELRKAWVEVKTPWANRGISGL